MKKLLSAAALTLGACLPAQAGSNQCAGDVVIDKGWVHVMDDLDITDSCKAKLGSPVAQRILRTCPGGTFCFIEMPLGDKARDKFDGRRLITRIDSISRSN
jgi:hypothetical protein